MAHGLTEKFDACILWVDGCSSQDVVCCQHLIGASEPSPLRHRRGGFFVACPRPLLRDLALHFAAGVVEPGYRAVGYVERDAFGPREEDGREPHRQPRRSGAGLTDAEGERRQQTERRQVTGERAVASPKRDRRHEGGRWCQNRKRKPISTLWEPVSSFVLSPSFVNFTSLVPKYRYPTMTVVASLIRYPSPAPA